MQIIIHILEIHDSINFQTSRTEIVPNMQIEKRQTPNIRRGFADPAHLDAHRIESPAHSGRAEDLKAFDQIPLLGLYL